MNEDRAYMEKKVRHLIAENQKLKQSKIGSILNSAQISPKQSEVYSDTYSFVQSPIKVEIVRYN